MEVWANSWRFGFMEVLELGAPETAPPPGQAHTHSQLGFREPKRLMSFEKLLKNPIPKDEVGYLNQRRWGMVSTQGRLPPTSNVEIPEQ